VGYILAPTPRAEFFNELLTQDTSWPRKIRMVFLHYPEKFGFAPTTARRGHWRGESSLDARCHGGVSDLTAPQHFKRPFE
jgi:hypothetical protein